MVDAAHALLAMGPGAVLLKGGARFGEDAVDVFCDRRQTLQLKAPTVATSHTHGAGCTLSAAICARLARGEELVEAVRGAKTYVTEALRTSYATGRGRGPLDHLHPLTRR
jgi:hydroxymethylpyrimidine/phosphomethylpyrimidine kinase